MMVSESITQLIRLIEHEVELYDMFLAATLKQRQALVNNVASEISAIAAQQDRLLRQISATENSAVAVMQRCAEMMELPVETATVAAIAERLDSPHSEQMTGVARALVETGYKVKRENVINRHLTNNLIRMTNFCLRGIAGINSPAPAYRPNGMVLQQPAQCLTLDSRV